MKSNYDKKKKNDVSSLSTYHKIIEQNLMIIVHVC